MAYDSADGYVVLSGGSGCGGNFGDSWTLKACQWSQLGPSSSPSARALPAMAYDAADGYVLLHGGVSTTTYYGDAWTLKAGRWSSFLQTEPPACAAASMALDVADSYVVMFGGSYDMRCICDLGDDTRASS